MAVKTLIVLVSFAVACGWALFTPLVGVVAYMGHYFVFPEQQCWRGKMIGHWGPRFAFIAAGASLARAMVNYRKLVFRGPAVTGELGGTTSGWGCVARRTPPRKAHGCSCLRAMRLIECIERPDPAGLIGSRPTAPES